MAVTGWRTRKLAALVALLLAATTLGPAPHALAVTAEFENLTPTYVGDAGFVVSNSVDIDVPGGSGGVGPASPYPSQINVSHSATILDVNVVIQGLTSTLPGDLNVLLVGPGGQQALVMSDVGGVSDVSGVTFILDDEAVATIGDGPITSLSYQPQNQGVDSDDFPAPAPALTGNTALSVFDGTIAGGVWSLYIVDDQSGDVHSIDGWSLRLTVATTPYPSTVQVSGMPAVSDVNVKLQGLTSGGLSDLHLLLVGPGGQQSYLMGDIGAGAVADVHVSVDDEAAVAFPASGEVSNGAYRPARYSLKSFPSPAPAASGNTALSVFDGLDPDGAWRLYAIDDTGGLLSSIDGWSLVFSWEDTTSPIGTVSINGGAVSTGSRHVMVDLSATDPDSGTGVAAVRLSNDGLTFSPYQAYAPSVAWTLSEGDGDKRVYAQFKDGAGNESVIVTDSITVGQDTTGPRAAKLSPRKNAAGVKNTVKVKVKATEALRKGSVSEKTVFLKKHGAAGKVPVKVIYKAATRTVVITPRSPLDRRATYVVTVKRVRDLAGNPWDQKPRKSGAQPLRYSFSTA